MCPYDTVSQLISTACCFTKPSSLQNYLLCLFFLFVILFVPSVFSGLFLLMNQINQPVD